jgi:hypothetical protein
LSVTHGGYRGSYIENTGASQPERRELRGCERVCRRFWALATEDSAESRVAVQKSERREIDSVRRTGAVEHGS